MAVQALEIKPFADALEGFQSACTARVRRVVIPETDGNAIHTAVETSSPDIILSIGMDGLRKVQSLDSISWLQS